MIEAIREIGEYVLGKHDMFSIDNFLKNICKPLKSIKNINGKEYQQYIVIINFNTKLNKIELEFERVNANNKDSTTEYLWIGNSKGKKDQIFLTTDKPIYLFNKSLPNIHKHTSGDFENKIKNILQNFFISVKKEKIIDCSKFEFVKEKSLALERQLNKIKNEISLIKTKKELTDKKKKLKNILKILALEKYKKDIDKFDKDMLKTIFVKLDNDLKGKDIFKRLDEYYKKDLLTRISKSEKKAESLITNDWLFEQGLYKNNVAVYTIFIDNKPFSKNEDYRKFIYSQKILVLFDKKNKTYKRNFTEKNYCSICKGRIDTTSNTTNLDFKYYSKDKHGFSSNLDGKFTKNFNICQECYQYLMVGENFIRNNLNAKIGLWTYIIPKFISETKLYITNFAKYLKNKTNNLTNLSDIKEIENFIEQFRRCEEGIQNYLINYLFYYQPPGSSEFKILKLIKDVPTTRLNYIQKIEDDISNLVDNKFDAQNYFKVSLNKLWGNIPVKKKDNHGYSKFLEIIDSIFSDISIDYSFLINQFTEVIKIIKFGNDNYNIYKKTEKVNKTEMLNKVLQQNFIILFIKKLGILGGINMSENLNITENEKLLLPKDILEYFTDLEIYSDRQKQALFLIGYLIGEIGNKQSQTSDTKKKPILNKINFQGMDYKKLMRLSNDIVEKLNQYKILSFNENIFSAVKKLLESNANWQLSNQENVFYVLSGYAYSNYMIRKRSKNIYNNLLNEANDNIKELKEEGKDTTEFEGFLQQAIDFANEGNYSNARNYLKKIKKENKDAK